MNNRVCSNSRRWALRKKTATILLQTKTLLVAMTLLVLATQWASATCGSSAQLQLPNVSAGQALGLTQESAATENTLDREHESGDKRTSITGLWKTVYVSGGMIFNVGFNIWHSDGTEWALDSLSPPFQGNTSAGVWEQVGRRTYRTIHPAFNYDAAGLNVVGVAIERVEVTLCADGNKFEGTFTFDNYDFQGNLLSGSVRGTITATRINVGDRSIPIPLK